MTKILAAFAVAFLIVSAAAVFGDVPATANNPLLTNSTTAGEVATNSDPVLGVWGGKWDDQWPVFLSVQAGTVTNTYHIRYLWSESSGDETFSHSERTGHQVNHHIEASLLSFKITGDTGMLHGQFPQPRMANLVRLSSIPKPDDADRTLRAAGWKEGAIPATDALKKITAE
jgi:hypothetical protein